MTIRLIDRVAESVRRRGRATVAEVLSDVGRYVSSAEAVAQGRRRHVGRSSRLLAVGELEAIGRRYLVNQALHLLHKRKSEGLCVERVGKGVWAWRGTLPFPNAC